MKTRRSRRLSWERPYLIHIALSRAELDAIDARARANGLCRSEEVRRCCLSPGAEDPCVAVARHAALARFEQRVAKQIDAHQKTERERIRASAAAGRRATALAIELVKAGRSVPASVVAEMVGATSPAEGAAPSPSAAPASPAPPAPAPARTDPS